MSTNACKLVCNDGEFFLAFSTTVDTFVSPPFQSAEEFAKYAAENLTVFGSYKATQSEWQNAAEETKDIYHMTKDAIHKGTFYLAQLKRGESLSNDEACELYEFWRFLRATVADQQHNYKETDKTTVNRWVRELNIRQQFPKNWDSLDILDHANWKVFQEIHHRRKHPDSPKIEQRSTPEQLGKLVGRYISALAILARIAGTDKRSPIEIVKAFLD